MKIAAIIQARMGSKRFPGKIMADLCGKPILQHVIERTKEIGIPVILSTPDKELAHFARWLGIKAGHGQKPPDVLRHYLELARAHELEFIMRITGDCPLLRPDLCKQVLDRHLNGNTSYTAIGWPRGGYPMGYGCEVFDYNALRLADWYATGDEREHVTPWMEEHLSCQYLENETDESDLNYCIDMPEDLERVREYMNGQNQDAT
jgi:spore coat polysaccharide biosynthesis protein SpsF (cytidylyltransferase family)